MSHAPANLKYASSHEWVLDNSDGTVTIGISDHAQELLGDIVYVELPDVGAACEATSDILVIESVKAASDIYAPVDGDIVEVNDRLDNNPEMINADCYHDGWLVKIKLADASQLDNLLDAAAYEASIEE